MDQLPDHEEAPRDRRRDVRMVVIGVAAVLLVWFALANTESVRVHFWVTSASSPVVLVIVIACLLGFLVGYLVGRRRKNRR